MLLESDFLGVEDDLGENLLEEKLEEGLAGDLVDEDAGNRGRYLKEAEDAWATASELAERVSSSDRTSADAVIEDLEAALWASRILSAAEAMASSLV